MAARFVLLAFAALTLAACETASTEDTGVNRGASPTFGDLSRHPRAQVRGPVVADATVAPTRARTAHAATRHAAASSSATRTASVIPNPMRAPRSSATPSTAAAAAVPAPAPSTLPTEPAQPAATAQTTAPPVTGSDTHTTIGAYPAIDPTAIPVSETVQPTPGIDFGLSGLSDLTIDKIEAMFGGMPFLLIASIAAALVAALGLAIRPSAAPKRDEDYAGPTLVDSEDYREPYAA